MGGIQILFSPSSSGYTSPLNYLTERLRKANNFFLIFNSHFESLSLPVYSLPAEGPTIRKKKIEKNYTTEVCTILLAYSRHDVKSRGVQRGMEAPATIKAAIKLTSKSTKKNGDQ